MSAQDPKPCPVCGNLCYGGRKDKGQFLHESCYWKRKAQEKDKK